MLRALVADGIDLIEVSGGSYEAPAMMGVRASTAAREAYFLEYARTVMDLAGEVPIAVTGGFRTQTAMAAAVATADCDIVGIGRPAATNPTAGTDLLQRGQDRLEVNQVKFGARPITGRIADLRVLDGALDLSWHTDQIHRLGRGLDPDPARSWHRAAVAMVTRNGLGAFRPKRGR